MHSEKHSSLPELTFKHFKLKKKKHPAHIYFLLLFNNRSQFLRVLFPFLHWTSVSFKHILKQIFWSFLKIKCKIIIFSFWETESIKIWVQDILNTTKLIKSNNSSLKELECYAPFQKKIELIYFIPIPYAFSYMLRVLTVFQY